jgi:hypothetical protein
MTEKRHAKSTAIVYYVEPVPMGIDNKLSALARFRHCDHEGNFLPEENSVNVYVNPNDSPATVKAKLLMEFEALYPGITVVFWYEL